MLEHARLIVPAILRFYIYFLFFYFTFFFCLFIFLDLTVCGTVTTGWVGRWSVCVAVVLGGGGGGVVSHIVATVFGSARSSARPQSSLVAGNAATI